MTKKITDKYTAMQSDLVKRASTGRLGKLTVSDFDSICHCGRELLEKHAVKTVIKAVADYFIHFGFMVTMDFDNVNYVIVEA